MIAGRGLGHASGLPRRHQAAPKRNAALQHVHLDEERRREDEAEDDVEGDRARLEARGDERVALASGLSIVIAPPIAALVVAVERDVPHDSDGEVYWHEARQQ